MLKKFTVKMNKGISIALLGVVVSAFLFISNATGQPDLAEAAAPSLDAAVSEMVGPMSQLEVNTVNAAGPTWITCTPVNVGVFDPRVHVQCNSGSISFFAKSTANANQAARVLSVLSIAHATGRTLNIEYDPADTSGTAIGCQANDCRLILGVILN